MKRGKWIGAAIIVGFVVIIALVTRGHQCQNGKPCQALTDLPKTTLSYMKPADVASVLAIAKENKGE